MRKCVIANCVPLGNLTTGKVLVRYCAAPYKKEGGAHASATEGDQYPNGR